MPEPIDFAQLAQQYRDGMADGWLIWLAEHAEEIAEEMLRREHAEFLLSLLPRDVDGDNQPV